MSVLPSQVFAYTGEKLAKGAKVASTKPRAIALKAQPGTISDEELEREKGGSGLRYSFDIKSRGVMYEEHRGPGRAAIIALQQFPIVNASLEGDNIRYHRHVNAGIAVALDWGLIVPVLKNADELNFLGLQRGITDLGERARSKKLMPQDVEGSTFTITNPGQFGAVFGLPIINQPNSAIMGVGGITKQPMVVTDKDGNDSIAIRSVVHLTLGYDHRLIDGAVADQFMALLKKTLENWSEDVG